MMLRSVAPWGTLPQATSAVHAASATPLRRGAWPHQRERAHGLVWPVTLAGFDEAAHNGASSPLRAAAMAASGLALAGCALAGGSAPGAVGAAPAQHGRVAMLYRCGWRRRKVQKAKEKRRRIKRELGIYKGDIPHKGAMYQASLVESRARSIARDPPRKVPWPDLTETIEPYLEEDKALLEEGHSDDEDEEEDRANGEVDEEDDYEEDYDPWDELFSNKVSKKALEEKKMKKRKHVVTNAEIDPEIHETTIKKANFLSQCPTERVSRPEFAVFGISNAGKSSFINLLVNRRKLVTISKRPGHTVSLWHILCDKSWYLVDMPGIGYAEKGLAKIKAMDSLIASYIEHRTTLVRLLYIIDVSEPLRNLDVESMKWLADAGANLTIILTKSDLDHKIGNGFPGGAPEEIESALYEVEGSPWRLGRIKEIPPMFMCSSKTKEGREAILEHIADWRARAMPRHKSGKSPVEKRRDDLLALAPMGVR